MHERHCLEHDCKLHLGAWEGDRACSSESCQLWSLRFHCGLHVWFQDAFCDRVETCVVWIFGCRHVRVLILVTCVSWGPNL